MLSTVQQMNVYVLQGLNKNAAATVTPREFDVLINASMIDYILQVARGVDKNQRAMDTLRVLRMPALVISNAGGQSWEQEEYSLPYDQNPAPGDSAGYLHMLNVGLKISKSVNGVAKEVLCRVQGGWASAMPLPADRRYNDLRDPFWSPTNEEPYYYLVGNTLKTMVALDSYSTQARIEYLRHPKPVSLVNNWQPELPAHVNQEICDYAIRRQLETIESPRYQSNLNERQLNA